MSIVIWLFAGGLVGWGVSNYLTYTRPEAIAFNVAVGVLGAILARWVVAPALGVPPGFGVFGLLVSAFGAAALLFCVHFVQQTAVTVSK
jgi:uncharacterized membrane protein YeaQ/YmgE (transglycosylase-associated protein family)